MTATGWVLKAGIVDVPDHLFALAVVPSEQGACLLTLDAAATDQGPITPMGRRTPIVESEQLKSEPLPSVPAPMGAWNNTPAPRSARNMPGAAGTSSRSSSANDESGSRSSAADDYDSEVSAEDDQIIQKDRVRATKRHVQAEIALLRDAIHRVCTVTGANHPRKIADDLPVLAGELSRLLGDKVVAETYLLILRGDLYRLDTLSPQVQKLVNLGLVHVEPLSAYKIAPVNPDD
jgi:hypothetical protein